MGLSILRCIKFEQTDFEKNIHADDDKNHQNLV